MGKTKTGLPSLESSADDVGNPFSSLRLYPRSQVELTFRSPPALRLLILRYA